MSCLATISTMLMSEQFYKTKNIILINKKLRNYVELKQKPRRCRRNSLRNFVTSFTCVSVGVLLGSALNRCFKVELGTNSNNNSCWDDLMWTNRVCVCESALIRRTCAEYRHLTTFFLFFLFFFLFCSSQQNNKNNKT